MSQETHEQLAFDNVVLIRVRVCVPPTSKKDNDLTNRLCSELKSDTNFLKVRKDLFRLTDVTKYRDAARRLLREKCVPWTNKVTDRDGAKKQDSWWATSGHQIKDVADELQALRNSFLDAAREKGSRYEDLLAEAQRNLGAAYNPDDFPTKEDFMGRFEWETEVATLTDVSDVEKDFRLRLPKQLADEQVERYRRDMGRRVHNIVADVMQRLTDRISGSTDDPGLVPRLRDYDPDPEDRRRGNTYRDVNLYDNIDDFRVFVDGVASIVDSPDLNALADRLEVFCTEIRPKDPQLVRNSDEVRDRVIQGLVGLMNPNEMPEPESVSVTNKTGGGFDQF